MYHCSLFPLSVFGVPVNCSHWTGSTHAPNPTINLLVIVLLGCVSLFLLYLAGHWFLNFLRHRRSVRQPQDKSSSDVEAQQLTDKKDKPDPDVGGGAVSQKGSPSLTRHNCKHSEAQSVSEFSTATTTNI